MLTLQLTDSNIYFISNVENSRFTKFVRLNINNIHLILESLLQRCFVIYENELLIEFRCLNNNNTL